MSAVDPVDLLHTLVNIPSPSGQEGEASHRLVAWMDAHGFEAGVDEVGNAVGSRGRGPRQILLLSHIDTFPGDLPVQCESDWLTGRGTVDAKGSLCAFAVAAALTDVREGWQVTVVGAVEEETASSRGARHLLARGTKPDYCVIGEPSGWERITLGYKGRLVADLCWRAPLSHSAGPGRLPAEQAVDIWDAVVAYCDRYNAQRQSAFERLDPSLRSIGTRDQGAHSVVEMTIGFRLPPDVEPVSLAEDVGQIARSAGLDLVTRLATGTVSGVIGAPGQSPRDRDNVHTARRASGQADSEHEVNYLSFSGEEAAFRSDKNNPLVRAFLAGIRQGGGQPRFVLKTGTADMNVVGPAWRVPIVAYGPGDSALDHTPEERINLSEYLRSIEVIKNVLGMLQRSVA